MTPVGDTLDAPLAGAQLQAAAADERRESATLEKETALNPVEAGHLNMEHLHDELEDFPSEEELHTLRRVSDHIPLKIFTIAFVELCERFSYYGSTVVCMSLPPKYTKTGN